MNNLPRDDPPVVNLEINFNYFMVDIFDEWKNHQDNADMIEDYEFVYGRCIGMEWSVPAQDFHKLINDEYADYLNKLIRNPSAFEDLTGEFFGNLNEQFEYWVGEEWIKIHYEKEEEETTS